MKLQPVGTTMIGLMLFFLAALLQRFTTFAWVSWIGLFGVIIAFFGTLWFVYDTFIK